ncbi:Glyoxylate reductase/hydroxypyruvate reductase [Psilocybe cubensis]|uniref:Glyoxylate reductase n=2 Tax=Psilocybe cubensis TaxID=181762 RepID=A0A8H7XNU4_PSICU|nr:Glyoxylate reductase/hydroxypyruvate reductase [Psilocybe cubensis]KAH9477830.1 Glyoxylate reductase/hydroxypyruvate reductase [Psilocybe cubensis]
MASNNSESKDVRHKIVLTRDLGPDVMGLLRDREENYLELVLWDKEEPCNRDWILKNAPGASALIVLITDKIDTEILDAAGPKLLVVSTMSVGYEHLPMKELAKRGIKVGYTPDVLTDAVADITIMLALMAGRNARETMNIVNEGKWPEYNWAPFLFCGRQLSTSASSRKRTAGFIGFGRIAQATLSRLIPFGFTDCIYTSSPSSKPTPTRDAQLAQTLGLRSVRRVNLGTLAEESDAVFVLAPGGEATLNLVDEQFLRKMKKTAVLVNTSRGTLVDSDALAKALREQWIWGAGLDVVKGEPGISADHPLVKEQRCAILPHIGSATYETRVEMGTLAVQNALAAIFEKPMPAAFDLTGYQ